MKIEEELNIFQDYIGLSLENILTKLNLTANLNSKNICYTIISRILNKSKRKILYENDYEIKVLRLNKYFTPKESISFPAFEYNKIINEEWTDSELFKQLNKKYIFFVFTEESKTLRFNCIKYWQISKEDLNFCLEIWNKVKTIIRNGDIVKEVRNGKRFTNFPKSSDNNIIHVRPHALNSNDTNSLPRIDKLTKLSEFTKHSFWLNKQYIKSLII